MQCPCCRTELVRGEDMRLETLCEHVCDANGHVSKKASFHCPNKNCRAHQEEIVWNKSGERYGLETGEKIAWIDGNDAPIPSFERQLYVEINKHDEDYKLCTVLGWSFYIKFQYKSNENGDILKRWRKLEIVRSDGVVYISGIRMLRHCLYSVYRNWKGLKKDPEVYWFVNELKRMAEKRFRKDEWWRKFARPFARLALWHRGVECNKADSKQNQVVV